MAERGEGAASPAGGAHAVEVSKPAAEEGKSKAQLRAERRAKQEAQRAAKAERTAADGKRKGSTTQKSAEKGKSTSDGASAGGGGAGAAASAVAGAGAAASSASSTVSGTGSTSGGGSGSTGSAGGGGGAGGQRSAHRVPANIQADDKLMQAKVGKKLAKHQIPQRPAEKKFRFLSHLHQFERDFPLTSQLSFNKGDIHPAILQLGLQYADQRICGSNARCVALMRALKMVVHDYTTPSEKEMSRDLEMKLKPQISFLTTCRPLSVSMGNAIKHFKFAVSQIPPETPEDTAKETLYSAIDTFVKERIQLADEAISRFAASKIKDGDVIMTYANSSIVRKILRDAHKSGKRFRVIVVDSRPMVEGRACLTRLVSYGIKCSYAILNSVCYVIKEVTKVLLGAHGILANGFVMSRVGSAMVSMMASAYHVPVLVACESYKFSDRVQTDAFVFNELGDPNDIASHSHNSCRVGGSSIAPRGLLADWQSQQHLSLLNLIYDVTPPEFISMVVTEVGMIPCTSVPVVLRVKNTGPGES